MEWGFPRMKSHSLLIPYKKNGTSELKSGKPVVKDTPLASTHSFKVNEPQKESAPSALDNRSIAEEPVVRPVSRASSPGENPIISPLSGVSSTKINTKNETTVINKTEPVISNGSSGTSMPFNRGFADSTTSLKEKAVAEPESKKSPVEKLSL